MMLEKGSKCLFLPAAQIVCQDPAGHDVKERMDAWDAPDGLFALQAKGSSPSAELKNNSQAGCTKASACKHQAMWCKKV